MNKITKKQFKNLFIFFSLILVIDYPLLPFLSSFISKKDFCEEYDTDICLLITLSFTAFVMLFWCVIWGINYIIFFMEDRRNQEIKKNLFLPFHLYIRYVQGLCKNSVVRSSSIALVLIILCFGAIYLLFRELLALLAI
jgi:hypothetical protein